MYNFYTQLSFFAWLITFFCVKNKISNTKRLSVIAGSVNINFRQVLNISSFGGSLSATEFHRIQATNACTDDADIAAQFLLHGGDIAGKVEFLQFIHQLEALHFFAANLTILSILIIE